MDDLDPKDLQPQTMLGMKLIQQPFSKLPDAENLFDFDSLKQTRDTISHHLQFSNLLMVIQCKKGGGKNSFANSLIVSEHPALYFFNATAEPGDNLRDILNKAAINNHADDISVLEKRIHDIMYRGQQPVIIINDADKLAETDLQDIIQYSQGKKDDNQQTQLKLLLLGDHSLEKKLETNGIVNHNQFYIIDLPQLNVSNTRAFLMHRLNLAGYRDASPFSDKDITNIYNMANGNPVATMEYAAEALNNNKSLYEETVSSGNKKRTTFILLAAALFVAAFVYNSLLNPELEDKKDISEQIALPPITDEKPAAPPEKKAIDQLFTNSSNTMAVKEQNKVETSGPQLAPDLNITSRNKPQQNINTEQLSVTNQNIVDSKNSDEKASDKPRHQTVEITPPVIKPAQTPSSGLPVPESIAGKQTTTPAAAKPVTPEKPATPAKAVKPAAKPTTDKTTQSFKNAGTHTSEWLLQQSASNWSLQILAAHKPETLLTYVHQHRLGNKVAYFKTRLGKNDWHVILYGQYPSKEKAKAVIPYLPAHIRNNNPWPKDMKSVQNAINQYKK